jgi:hypothetical protein
MLNELVSGWTRLRLSGYLLCATLTPALLAQTASSSQSQATINANISPSSAHIGSPSRYRPDQFAGRAGMFYRSVWGVDSLSVKAAESGDLIRFSYRILDPQKAKVFNDKNIAAYLNSPEHRIQLVVPALEKVGQLRQSNAPVVGTSYWMAFSNPHRTVKRGERVNVVIGQFHADGLIVE